ncbi:MAG: Coq4 family protein [Micropepsaceae bacterium]
MSVTEIYRAETSVVARNQIENDTFRLKPVKALRALFRLFKNKEDTSQVFEIMRALSGKSVPNGYMRLLSTPLGGAIAYRRLELAQVLSDRAFLESLPAGSVGRAYLDFVTRENISAEGLIAESRKGIDDGIDSDHPYAWYGRRMRDVHDLWHILTGYSRDAIGEACVVAFSYAQTRSPGFALIAVGGALKLRSALPGQPIVKAVWEAYQNGRKASWLPSEDYLKLLAEPLEAARARLNIARPGFYEKVPQDIRDSLGADLQMAA